jgi:hypothetical protein
MMRRFSIGPSIFIGKMMGSEEDRWGDALTAVLM